MPIARPYLVLVLVAVAVAGCGGRGTTSAGLQPTPTTPAPPATQSGTVSPAPPSDQDRIWMKTIHQGNMTEVQAGRLAERKGTAAAVKELGAMLLKEHTQFDTELVAAARRLGVELPGAVDAEQKEAVNALEDASREDFDQLLLSTLRKEHVAAIEATRTEIERGASPEVKALAQKTLPALERHLEEIKAALGGDSTSSPSPS